VPNRAADIFLQAASLCRDDPRRRGSLIELDEGCTVLVAGDIHGNRANFTRIVSYARLAADPHRRLVLQEIIHGPPDARTGHDRSVDLLLRAARLKVERPAQVLFLIGNHDASQVTGGEITKDGRGVCKAFAEGVRYAFADDGDEVLAAIGEFLLSAPLAVRTPGGVLISHSLPSPHEADEAGVEILHRPCALDDLRRGRNGYEWVWGRRHDAEQVEALADALGVEFFLLGHYHIEAGYEVICPRVAALASDSAHGCVAEFSGDEPLASETFEAAVRHIVALR